MLKESVNGFLAGLMISIGGSVYLALIDNKVVGAILFSVALFTICLMSLSLFTGKIGFVVEDHSKSNIVAILTCLLGNLIGTVVFGLLIKVGIPSFETVANNMCKLKLEQKYYETLIRAFFCGVLMYVAVWSYKIKKTVLGIFVCIPVFILSGFEHSIADMFYMAAAGQFNLSALLFIVIVVVGNAIGGIIIPLLGKLATLKTKKEL